MVDRHHTFGLLVFAAALVTSVSGCRNFPPGSETDSVKAGIKLSLEGLSRDPSLPEVVVYYAADTTLKARAKANYELLNQKITTLASRAGRVATEKEALNRLVERINSDIKTFPQQVQTESELLVSKICGQPNLGLIVITNSDFHKERVLYCLPGKPEASVAGESAAFARLSASAASVSDDFRLEASPLSAEVVLDSALTLTESLFAPESHEFALVLESHGNAQMVLVPRLVVDMNTLPDEELETIALSDVWARSFFGRAKTYASAIYSYFNAYTGGGLEKERLDKDKLDKDKLEKERLEKERLEKERLEKERLEKERLDKGNKLKKGNGFGLAADPAPVAGRTVGVTKDALVNILNVKHNKMYFGLVFMESCNSELLDDQLWKLAETMTPNVGVLFSSDPGGLDYATLDYGMLNPAGESALPKIRNWYMRALTEQVGR